MEDEFIEDDDFESFFQDEINTNDIDAKYLECLKEKFGHTSFRTMQWKVISSVLFDKRDNCVVMATGYGKSLCYQFVSVLLDTVTVVVSPLISLMEDQVLSLEVANIKACLLGSAQKNKSVFDDVLQFKYNIVYVTPEFLTGSFGENFLVNLSPKLSLIAIDEAHCISKWGHDFRSAFRNLGFIRSCVPKVPIMAMTATATKDVQNDICSSLKLKDPQIVCTGFDRPNLEFNVAPKGTLGAWKDIGGLLKSLKIGSAIIYCLTRKSTEELCQILQSNGITCKAYHAGLSLKERTHVHEDFVRDKLQVIVATIAFGMGIDKPDIRMVIHYGASKDMESYYQEVGRAGRDGMFSRCFMFYSNQDWKIHDMLLSNSSGSSEIKENRRNLSLKIREYCTLSSCRREYIIKYFEGAHASCPNKPKKCCDNCGSASITPRTKLSEMYEELNDDGYCDFTKDAEHFMNTLSIMDGWKGLTTIIHFLRGSKRQTLGERYFANPLFGVGKHRSEEYYKMLADLLEINGYIAKKSLSEKNPKMAFTQKHLKYIQVLTLTNLGRTWMNMGPKKNILLKPAKTMYKYFKLKQNKIQHSAATGNFNSKLLNIQTKPTEKNSFNDLVTSLLKVRSSLASTMDVMPYMVLSNKAIYQLAQKCPLNIDEYKAAELDGVSDIKAKKFGPAFIKCILKYKNLIPNTDDANVSTNDKSIAKRLEGTPIPDIKPLSSTISETFALFQAGKCIREIAQIRHLAESTISGYINVSIKHGLISSLKELHRLGVSDSIFHSITNVYKKINDKKVSLKTMKEKLDPTVTFDMIQFVLSYHHVREHLDEMGITYTDPDKFIKKNECKENLETNQQCEENKFEEWESDDYIDYTKVENDIAEANSSLVNTDKKDCSRSDKTDEELNWAIDNMKSDESDDNTVVENITAPQNIVASNKRKINVKRKAFVYEDSSSSEDENKNSKKNCQISN